jgi:hypothetical protein
VTWSELNMLVDGLPSAAWRHDLPDEGDFVPDLHYLAADVLDAVRRKTRPPKSPDCRAWARAVALGLSCIRNGPR